MESGNTLSEFKTESVCPPVVDDGDTIMREEDIKKECDSVLLGEVRTKRCLEKMCDPTGHGCDSVGSDLNGSTKHKFIKTEDSATVKTEEVNDDKNVSFNSLCGSSSIWGQVGLEKVGRKMLNVDHYVDRCFQVLKLSNENGEGINDEKCRPQTDKQGSTKLQKSSTDSGDIVMDTKSGEVVMDNKSEEEGGQCGPHLEEEENGKSPTVVTLFKKVIRLTMYLACKVRICEKTQARFDCGDGRIIDLSRNDILTLKTSILSSTNVNLNKLAENVKRFQQIDDETFTEKNVLKLKKRLLFELQEILFDGDVRGVGTYLFCKDVKFGNSSKLQQQILDTVCDHTEFAREKIEKEISKMKKRQSDVGGTASTPATCHSESDVKCQIVKMSDTQSSRQDEVQREKEFNEMFMKEKQRLCLVNRMEQTMASVNRKYFDEIRKQVEDENYQDIDVMTDDKCMDSSEKGECSSVSESHTYTYILDPVVEDDTPPPSLTDSDVICEMANKEPQGLVDASKVEKTLENTNSRISATQTTSEDKVQKEKEFSEMFMMEEQRLSLVNRMEQTMASINRKNLVNEISKPAEDENNQDTVVVAGDKQCMDKSKKGRHSSVSKNQTLTYILDSVVEDIVQKRLAAKGGYKGPLSQPIECGTARFVCVPKECEEEVMSVVMDIVRPGVLSDRSYTHISTNAGVLLEQYYRKGLYTIAERYKRTLEVFKTIKFDYKVWLSCDKKDGTISENSEEETQSTDNRYFNIHKAAMSIKMLAHKYNKDATGYLDVPNWHIDRLESSDKAGENIKGFVSDAERLINDLNCKARSAVYLSGKVRGHQPTRKQINTRKSKPHENVKDTHINTPKSKPYEAVTDAQNKKLYKFDVSETNIAFLIRFVTSGGADESTLSVLYELKTLKKLYDTGEKVHGEYKDCSEPYFSIRRVILPEGSVLIRDLKAFVSSRAETRPSAPKKRSIKQVSKQKSDQAAASVDLTKDTPKNFADDNHDNNSLGPIPFVSSKAETHPKVRKKRRTLIQVSNALYGTHGIQTKTVQTPAYVDLTKDTPKDSADGNRDNSSHGPVPKTVSCQTGNTECNDKQSHTLTNDTTVNGGVESGTVGNYTPTVQVVQLATVQLRQTSSTCMVPVVLAVDPVNTSPTPTMSQHATDISKTNSTTGGNDKVGDSNSINTESALSQKQNTENTVSLNQQHKTKSRNCSTDVTPVHSDTIYGTRYATDNNSVVIDVDSSPCCSVDTSPRGVPCSSNKQTSSLLGGTEPKQNQPVSIDMIQSISGESGTILDSYNDITEMIPCSTTVTLTCVKDHSSFATTGSSVCSTESRDRVCGLGSHGDISQEDKEQSSLLYEAEQCCSDIVKLLHGFIEVVFKFPKSHLSTMNNQTTESGDSFLKIKDVFSLQDPSATKGIAASIAADKAMFSLPQDVPKGCTRQTDGPPEKFVLDDGTEVKVEVSNDFEVTETGGFSHVQPVIKVNYTVSPKTDTKPNSNNLSKTDSERDTNNCQLQSANKMISEIIASVDAELNDNARVVMESVLDQLSHGNKILKTELDLIRYLLKQFKQKKNIEENRQVKDEIGLSKSIVRRWEFTQLKQVKVIYHLLNLRMYPFMGFQEICCSSPYGATFGYVPAELELCAVMEDIHGKRLWMCAICYQKFDVVESYLQHETVVHSRALIFACPTCELTFTSYRVFENHPCTAYEGGQFNESETVSRRLEVIDQHSKVRGDICYACLYFKNFAKRKEIWKSKTNLMYRCKLCDSSSFQRATMFNRHMSYHKYDFLGKYVRRTCVACQKWCNVCVSFFDTYVCRCPKSVANKNVMLESESNSTAKDTDTGVEVTLVDGSSSASRTIQVCPLNERKRKCGDDRPVCVNTHEVLSARDVLTQPRKYTRFTSVSVHLHRISADELSSLPKHHQDKTENRISESIKNRIRTFRERRNLSNTDKVISIEETSNTDKVISIEETSNTDKVILIEETSNTDKVILIEETSNTDKVISVEETAKGMQEKQRESSSPSISMRETKSVQSLTQSACNSESRKESKHDKGYERVQRQNRVKTDLKGDKQVVHVGKDKQVVHVGMDKQVVHVGMDKQVVHVGMDKQVVHVGMDKQVVHVGMNKFVGRHAGVRTRTSATVTHDNEVTIMVESDAEDDKCHGAHSSKTVIRDLNPSENKTFVEDVVVKSNLDVVGRPVNMESFNDGIVSDCGVSNVQGGTGNLKCKVVSNCASEKYAPKSIQDAKEHLWELLLACSSETEMKKLIRKALQWKVGGSKCFLVSEITEIVREAVKVLAEEVA